MTYHTLDPDSPAWHCVTCDARWSGAAHFMNDNGDCVPVWFDRARADAFAPIVWAGTPADEYAGAW